MSVSKYEMALLPFVLGLTVLAQRALVNYRLSADIQVFYVLRPEVVVSRLCVVEETL